MDPNACLKRIIDAARDNDQDEYVSACEDLAGWLKAGGFAPTVPEGTPYIPGTNTQWSLLPPGLVGFYTTRWRLVCWGPDGRSVESYVLA